MTQFVVVCGEMGGRVLPAGISAVLVEPGTLVARVSDELFSAGRSRPVYRIYETVSGEADVLCDEAYDTIAVGAPPRQSRLVGMLVALAVDGYGIACWYGSDWSELPVASDAGHFERLLLRSLSDLPPEVYVLLLPQDNNG